MSESSKASAELGRPSTSKVAEVRTDVLTEPITVELDPTKPVSFMENPDALVPHERIPVNLRTAIVETYGEAFFNEKEWTIGVLTRLARAISHPRENITHAVAQICGPNCTLKDGCPYDIVGRAPIGERCPLELKIAGRLYDEYVKAVSDRLRLDAEEIKTDIVLHNIINGIVESDIIEMRLNGSIAEDGFTTEVPTVVNENTGEVYYKDEEAIPVKIKERITRRRDMLFRQLLATPEMAAKYKNKSSQDAVARSAKLLDRMERVVAALEDGSIKDAELIDGTS